MHWFDLFWHMAGLLMPALAVAPTVVLAGWLMDRRSKPGRRVRRWSARLAINLGVCVGVLLAGLMLTGHDGRMVTYAALVLGSASTECLLLGRWRA